MRERLLIAKSTAVFRAQAESRITQPMLYVKGWPLRMLTDEEADILASVRQEVSALLNLSADHLDRHSIHERYDSLLRAKAIKVGLEGA
ncbi:hypothetical protein [Rhizobium laguerreae]|uniref:Uncharacterized protein n=1 Tax=Rhizobium laguerreae TaxID=1076926 RepID=A0AAX2QLP1_9HYPH|nr:hypothetical protein [Rhizobium laguerreae]TCU25304.1 hypothetical protein EV131_105418 [Rhizobium laguerreae]